MTAKNGKTNMTRLIPTVRETVVFGMLGAIMFAAKFLMEALPNVHLLALFIVSFTVVYRAKALWPIYVYVLLDGIFAGFSSWWLPYLYIWTLLWGTVMLLPKKMPPAIATLAYAAAGGLHGLLFGVLYAPVQALLYGMTFEATVAWVVAGLPFDMIHALSNTAACLLVLPLSALLKKLGGQGLSKN